MLKEGHRRRPFLSLRTSEVGGKADRVCLLAPFEFLLFLKTHLNFDDFI